MTNTDDHRWDLDEDDSVDSPEADEAFEKKLDEWQERNWMDWLGKQLTFPFRVVRKEDDDDVFWDADAAKSAFRLDHKMKALSLEEEEDIDRGIMMMVSEKGQTGSVPLADLQVTPKSDKNFWPIREYVVWFANRS
jgi:hypothetical protein